MSGETAFLIPGQDLLVRDPMTKNPLATGGEIKPLIGPEGRYWRRRIKDGSVTIGSPQIVPSSSSVAPSVIRGKKASE